MQLRILSSFIFVIIPSFLQAQTLSLAAVSSPTLWTVLQKGGWAIVPLLLLSAVTTVLILYCFLSFRAKTIVTPALLQTIDAHLQKKDLLGLNAYSTTDPKIMARIVQKTLTFHLQNPDARFALLREMAETEGSRQASRMYQQVTYLFDIGIIAPMVGLAGTVTGMITSFNIIGLDPNLIRPATLANGVAEALIATAGGLVVGIPAMIFYSFFKGRVQYLISELESHTTQFLARLEMEHTSNNS
ncbi:MAG: MotA/TolQ/ExbB proton channel family protein [Verrucomicrobiae bacterium]|nr:MotA/TolQ/ExbB proton channel family protein [Verrucomicrobiae bacterium]